MVSVKQHKNPKKRQKNVILTVLIVSFVTVSCVAAFGGISSPERSVFNAVYNMPDSLWKFAIFITQFGNAWVVVGLVGLFFVLRWSPNLSLIILRNAAIAYLAVEVMKFIVGRPRPALLLTDIVSKELIVFGKGFPSGHTAMATVLGLTILPYIPNKLRWLIVLWIMGVAWSRIYLGVHAPLDVVGGFLLGSIVVLAVSYLPSKLQLRVPKR